MSSQDLEVGALAKSPVKRVTPTPPCKGFIGVTAKIISDPDKSTTLYRRFDALSARNLVFYQAELAELEEQQKGLDDEDSKCSDEESEKCQRDWDSFVRSAKVLGEDQKKMDLAMKIRDTLEKYRS
jgi:hypothetical protein